MNTNYVAGQNIMYNKPKTKKKKAPKNAFSFYLDDVMKEMRRRGQHVESKAAAVPHANEKWKNMSAAEKAPYEKKVHEWKSYQKQLPKSGRLDCTGQLIDERVNMQDLTETQRKQARKAIRNEWPAGKDVCDVHFYFISFQSLFELPDEEGYQPCEVACIDYTLNGGIERVYHQFIDPGPIKLGMRSEIRIFSEKTHQIPEEGFEHASSQYPILWNELLQFVKPDRSSSSFPPLFCRMNEMRKTQFCLDWLSANAGVCNKLCQVFEIEDIAAELYVHGGMMRPSLTIIEEGCASHMYDYEGNTSCWYHEEVECIHCALLTIKKCCYWISDSLAKVYGYEITDRHLPVKKPPSFIITRPEMVAVDSRPHRHSQQNNYGRRHNGGSPSGGETMVPRDIRYRSNYDIVPSRRECTSFSPPATSSLCNEAEVTSSGDVGNQRSHLMNRNTPSLGAGRRPTTSPNYMRSLPQQAGSRLAANFQMKPKSSADESCASNSNIDQLSQEFDAASVSSVGTSEPDEGSASRPPQRAMLGRGRGRARFM